MAGFAWLSKAKPSWCRASDDLSSLSAILLNDDDYALIQAGRRVDIIALIDGLDEAPVQTKDLGLTDITTADIVEVLRSVYL
ncbi:MAG: hypothetical protein EA402_02385 [Planctomycetota bacterium]|nr:MAG: hypothetical protein EA402_02385 [Planctomycetota bacterium]